MKSVNKYLLLSSVFIFLSGIFPTGTIAAQELKVSAMIDTSGFLLGDWIPVKVEANYPADIIVFPPDISQGFGELELVKMDSFDPEIKGTIARSRWLLTLSGFDTGSFTIPPLQIKYHSAGDTAISVAETDSIIVHLASTGGDTLSAPHDIKPPLNVPLEFADFLPYIILLLLIAASIYIYWRWKNRKRILPLSEPAPSVPQLAPYDLAIKRIVELENKKYVVRGFIKEYYSELTEILREYYEKAFGFPAMESTTDDILEHLKKRNLFPEKRDSELFIVADLVKFAKSIPDLQQCNTDLQLMSKLLNYAHSLEKPVETREAETINPNP